MKEITIFTGAPGSPTAIRRVCLAATAAVCTLLGTAAGFAAQTDARERATVEAALLRHGSWNGGADGRVISAWNELAHDIAVAEDQFLTFKGQRALAMMHLAMHDALNSIVPVYERYVYTASRPAAHPVAAAAQAAYDVLRSQYPDQQQRLADELAVWLGDVPDTRRREQGIELGQSAAAAILERRADDGWNLPGSYEFRSGAGQYQTTPPWDGFVAQPGFRFAKPFTPGVDGGFLPSPPPSLRSARYANAFQEVKEYGARASTRRTADQTAYALWWMEFAEGSVNRLSRKLVARHDLHLWATSRLFAHIAMALFDGYVANWNSKYEYNHWRPYTAIRAADTDDNPRTMVDHDWEPLRPTPPFPEYASAHATGCAASFAVLEDTFGEHVPFTMETTTAPPGMPTREFASFRAAAQECADSRVRLGWHFRYATDAGLEVGRDIALHTIRRSLRRLRLRADEGVSPSRLVERIVQGRALEGNVLGEDEDRKVLIYLPRGYDERLRMRYPVVYLLGGLGGDHRNFAQDGTPNRLGLMRSPQVTVGLDMRATADALIESGQVPEAILVGVSGVNTYANHWFACSSIIGDYRSWVASDIVRFVDREYRTRQGRNGRAILGHSSGGFGALSMAIEYPHTFGAVGILSPAGSDFAATVPGSHVPRLLELFFRANPASIAPPVTIPVTNSIPDTGFAALWGGTPGGGSFITNVIYSLAAAFSPNLRNRPFPLDFPFVYPQQAIVPEVFARWQHADLVSQVDAAPGNLARTPVYLARGLGPTALHPEVGDILLLRNALMANGVVHTFDELPGDHFTVMPQELHNALVFVLNKLGSQDQAPFSFNGGLRDEHRACRKSLRDAGDRFHDSRSSSLVRLAKD